MKTTTDMIAVIGLVIVLVIGVLKGASPELLTGIAGGLSGYISKTVMMHQETIQHEKALEKSVSK